MTVLSQSPSLTVSPVFVTQLFCDLMQATEMESLVSHRPVMCPP